MRMYFTVNKQEQINMNCFECSGSDFLKAIFKHLPQKIIRHSKRVSELAGILAEYIPENQIPKGINSEAYRTALQEGAYYHDIGVYLARNEINDRPAAAERLLIECRFKDVLSDYSEAVLETARYSHNWYAGNEQLKLEHIPLHASLCAIADAADMFMCGIGFNGKKIENASEYIRQNSGRLFNPDAVSYFEQAKAKILDIYEGQAVAANVKKTPPCPVAKAKSELMAE